MCEGCKGTAEAQYHLPEGREADWDRWRGSVRRCTPTASRSRWRSLACTSTHYNPGDATVLGSGQPPACFTQAWQDGASKGGLAAGRAGNLACLREHSWKRPPASHPAAMRMWFTSRRCQADEHQEMGAASLWHLWGLSSSSTHRPLNRTKSTRCSPHAACRQRSRRPGCPAGPSPDVCLRQAGPRGQWQLRSLAS